MKELPERIIKTLKENPYIEKLSTLVEKTDGNDICLIYGVVDDYFSKYNVSEKQQTLKTLIRLYCQKVCEYCSLNYEIFKEVKNVSNYGREWI